MTDVPAEQLELAGSAPIVNLTYSWGERPGAPGTFTRVALGDLYILSAPYSGTPGNLSTAASILAVVSSADITTDSSGSYWNFSLDPSAKVRVGQLRGGAGFGLCMEETPQRFRRFALKTRPPGGSSPSRAGSGSLRGQLLARA
jgi:hypothetical protein